MKVYLYLIYIVCFLMVDQSAFAIDNLPCGKARTDEEKAACYSQIGKEYQKNGQFKLGLENLIEAKTIYLRINQIQAGTRLLRDISTCYASLGQLNEAIQTQQEFVNYLSKQKNTTDELVQAKEKLAELQAKNQQFSAAQKEIKEVQKIEIDRKNKKGVIKSSANYKYYSNQSEEENQTAVRSEAAPVAEAISFDDADLKTVEKVKDEELVETYDAISNLYNSEGAVDKSIEFKTKAVNTAKTIGRKDLVLEKNIELAQSLIKNKRAKEAIPILEKTIKLADSIGSVEGKQKALKELSIAYQLTGQTENANETLENYASTLDSTFRQRLKQIEVATELLNTQKQVELLEKDRLADSNKIALQNKSLLFQKWIIGISLFALIGALVAVFLIYKNSKAKRRANLLLALKSLRIQMNPHFIFNALNSVNNYISQQDERAANKFLSEFSKLMRMVMEYSQHDFITLSQEKNILELYLKLEHHRFQDKFNYTFEVDDELDTEYILLPPMLIQPYIENAIWHGLRYKEEKGMLSISIQKNQNFIIITIDDNGIGRTKSLEIKTKNQKEHNSTGMKNIESRLDILNEVYNTKIKVDVQDKNLDGSGTKVLIQIPENSFIKH